MKKVSFIMAVAAIVLVSFKTIAPSSWKLDQAHSQLGFSLSLLMISDIQGTFKIKEGSITAPKDDFSDAVVSLVADMNSIDTDNDDRDKHLRTADFFDTEKYPNLTFKSSSFTKTGGDNYKVTGDLTFHGITKQVVLNAVGKTTTHPVTNQIVAGFRVTGTIKRSDFGISPATPSSMLGDEVTIDANVQFTKN